MSDAASRRAQSKLKTPSREMAAKAEEVRATEAAKTARLRGLRLAKEAADREAALQASSVALASSATPRRRAHETRKPPVRGVS
jgi:hypothetical protein